MNPNDALSPIVMHEIIAMAQNHRIRKVILFGSRARGSHHERSDIDLAVYGSDVAGFYTDLNENAWTLLTFDVVDLNKNISEALQQEIHRDGMVIYEEN